MSVFDSPLFDPISSEDLSFLEPKPVKKRNIGDIPGLRNSVFDSVLNAARNLKPVQNQKYTLTVKDVDYDKDKEFTKKDIKKALLEGGTLSRKLKGTWVLADTETGAPIQEYRTTLANVPYITDNGTVVRKGSQFVLKNQSRLLPGVYTRRKENDEIESHVNTLPHEGPIHRYSIDPSTGEFSLVVKASKTPLVSLLKSMGASDDEMKEAWGEEVFNQNIKKFNPSHRQKIFEKILGARRLKEASTDEDRDRMIREAFEKMSLDPEVSQSTLGQPFANLNKDAILQATRRLIGVSKHMEESDDRDNLAYQEVYGPEDLFSERVEKDHLRLRRDLLNRITFRNMSLDKIPTGYLTKQLDDAILSSGLGMSPEEINAGDVLDKVYSISRMGAGGIPCHTADTEVYTEVGWKFWPDLEDYDKVLTMTKDGKQEYVLPCKVIRQPYYGEIYVCDSEKIAYAVTPNHNMWVREPGSGEEFRMVTAEECHGQFLEFMTGYSGKGQNHVGTGDSCFDSAVYRRIDRREYGGGMGDSHGDHHVFCVDVQGRLILTRYKGKMLWSFNSVDSIPDESRSVHASQRGFNDIFRTPECFTEKGEIMTLDGWVNVSDITLETKVACTDELGKIFYACPERVHHYDYNGNIYSLEEQDYQLDVTADHRMYVRLPHKEEYEFYTAEALFDAVIPFYIRVAANTLVLEVYVDRLSRRHYHGLVYCVTVSGGLVWAKHEDSMFGVLTGNSLKVGVDLFLAANVRKGEDRQLYIDAIDPKSGDIVEVTPKKLLGKTVAVQSEYLHDRIESRIPGREPWVPAIRNGKIDYVPVGQVDYLLPHNEDGNSPLGQLIPLKSASKAQRNAMGGRMYTQALPLVNAEAPLVQSGVPGMEDTSFEDIYGFYFGSAHADQGGTVISSDQDSLKVRYDDGTVKTFDMDYYSPTNRKTYRHNEAVVNKGDRFKPGQLLVKSNMTDNNGTVAMGRNARVAFMPWEGLTYEDAIVVSESFAERMKSQHMYKNKQEWSPTDRRGKGTFMSVFPGRYDKTILDKMDDQGIVQVGQTVNKDDPLILGLREADPDPRFPNKGKKLYSDATLTWDHKDPGIVTDVFDSDKGTMVLVKTEADFQVGDKLSGRWGNKGVVSKILPDNKMPQLPDGPAEVVLNSTGVDTRTNPSQLVELALSKVAKKTGKPYKLIDGEAPVDWAEFALAEAKKHNVPVYSDVVNPNTGQVVRNPDGTGIADGYMFLMKLHHSAEGKGSARGFGGYTATDQPAKGGQQGSKRLANMHISALNGYGAYNLLRDDPVHKGTRNDDYWFGIMQGKNPVLRKTPFVQEKFVNELKAAGINVVASDNRYKIMALTDKDIEKMASPVPVTNSETIRWEHGRKMPSGGLFDPMIFGRDGMRWGRVDLTTPTLNPVMEDPARYLLGLTQSKFYDVMKGKETLGKYGTGMKAIQDALSDIRLPEMIRTTETQINQSRGSARDEAVRRLGYLKGAENTGIHPGEWVLNSVPVLPPRFRPISEMSNKTPLVSDANYLYKLLIDVNNTTKDLKQSLPETHDENFAVYDTFRQLVGLAEPTHPKLTAKNVQGILRGIFGEGSSKFSAMQRQLLGGPVDLVGRAVITPDPDLGMDEVGIPEDSAWQIYRPFIIGRLAKRGMGLSRAVEQWKNKTTEARDMLLAEMEKRPVYMDRAPVLHSTGILGAWPRLTKGDTLKISPLVTKTIAGDFDGNCIDFDEVIYLSLSKSPTDNDTESSYDESNVDLHIFTQSLEGIEMRTIYDEKILTVKEKELFKIKIGQFPKMGLPVKDKNGADVYKVPDGVNVITYDHEICELVTRPVTWFTVEENVKCSKVTTSCGKTVIVSDNESLAAFCKKTGSLIKLAPKDAMGKLLPVVKVIPGRQDGNWDFEFGYWYGAFISDGWKSSTYVGYTKLDDEKRDLFVKFAREKIHENFVYNDVPYVGIPGADKYGNSKKIHLRGLDLLKSIMCCYDSDFTWHKVSGEFEDDKVQRRGALYKTIPSEILERGSRECLLGVLAGLISGDGTLTWNYAAKNPRFAARLATSSPYLVKSCRTLGQLLGFRMSVTESQRQDKHPEFSICFSIPDLWKNLKDLRFFDTKDNENWQKFLAGNEPSDDRDLIAATDLELQTMRSYFRAGSNNYDALYKATKTSYLTRMIAKRVCEALPADLVPELRKRIANESVTWSKYDSYEPVGKRNVYDIGVEGTKVFVIENGLVIYDTMNFAVPSTDAAIEDVTNLMLPSKNLLSASDMKNPIFFPQHEAVGGLYSGSQKPELESEKDGKRKRIQPKVYADKKSVAEDLASGRLKPDDPVIILSED